MKRWFLLAAFTAAFPIIALACGGDDSPGGGPTGTPDSGKPNPTVTTPTSTATNTVPTSTTTVPNPVDAGPDAAAKRKGCLDRPTGGAQRPDKLPCELIPPGLTL